MSLAKRPRLGQAQSIVPDAETVLGDDPDVSIPTTAGGTALPNVPEGCRHAYFTVETWPVRLRPVTGSGGGDPSSTEGVLLNTGEGFDLTADPTLFKLIGVGGTAKLNVLYLGEN